MFLVKTPPSNTKKRSAEKGCKPGSRFLLGAGLYAGSRFLIDFLRDDLQRHPPWNLASTQWVGIAVLCSLLLVWYCLDLAHKRREPNGASTGE